MKLGTTIGSVLAVALLAIAGLVPAGSAGSTPTVKFGMGIGSMQNQIDLGIRPDYAQFWAGVWNEKAGWSYLGTQADQAADKGVTPVVQWWYWGDDISRTCVSNGCWSNLHDAAKSRSKWAADAAKLADALHAGLKGRPGIVVIESEFNKNGIATWETFDGYLAEHAKIFRARAPEVKLVLGFGNWGSGDWYRFDRAVAAMDMTGFQTMRGSTRDSWSSYLNAVDTVKAATVKLKGTFGKPVLLHDFCLSSYGSGYEANQEKVVKELFARMGELRSAGLTGVIYRDLKDNAHMDLANYYGWAERYMGLKRSDGSSKPALNDWVGGVKAARGTSSGGTTTTSPPGFDATFAPKSQGNDWWVEAKVGGGTITKVEAKVDSGAWTSLPKTSWGTWAKSIHADGGSKVQFRAWNSAGASDLSAVYTWW